MDAEGSSGNRQGEGVPAEAEGTNGMNSHWKTSCAGFLSAFLGAVGPLTAYLATTSNPKATEVCGALTCAAAIARIWIGLLQNDAPAPAQMLVVTPPSTQVHEAEAVPVLVPKSPGDVALPRDAQGRITQNPN